MKKNQNLQEIKRMQQLAGIPLKECGMSMGLDQHIDEDNLEEMGENPVVDTAVAATVGAGVISLALKAIVSHYKEIRKSDPNISPKEAVLQALSKTAGNISSAKK
jgi:hypothetical protein